MSQQDSVVSIILTVDQIKQRMPLLRGKIPPDQKMFVCFFQREKGRERSEELGRWYNLFSFLVP